MGSEFRVSGTFVISVCMEFGVKRGSCRVLTQPHVCAMQPALQGKWNGYGQVCVQARAGVRAGGVCLVAREASDNPLEYRTGTLTRASPVTPLDTNAVRQQRTQPSKGFTPTDSITIISTPQTLTTASRVRYSVVGVRDNKTESVFVG